MSPTKTTRIKLPEDAHARVKAEAAFNNVNLDSALGMCVAFLCNLTTPLSWRTDPGQTRRDIAAWLQKQSQS